MNKELERGLKLLAYMLWLVFVFLAGYGTGEDSFGLAFKNNTFFDFWGLSMGLGGLYLILKSDFANWDGGSLFFVRFFGLVFWGGIVAVVGNVLGLPYTGRTYFDYFGFLLIIGYPIIVSFPPSET